MCAWEGDREEKETKTECTVIRIILKCVTMAFTCRHHKTKKISGIMDGTLTDCVYVSMYKIIVSLSQASLN